MVNASFVLPVHVPSLPEQLAAFLSTSAPNASDVNLLVIGNNDLLQALFGPMGSPIQPTQYEAFASNITATYTAALSALYAAGARLFILTASACGILLLASSSLHPQGGCLLRAAEGRGCLRRACRTP